MDEELDVERTRRADHAKKVANSFWQDSYTSKYDPTSYYEEYLKRLFPLELKYILRYGEKPEPFKGTLVFLLGHSLEPLFFSLCIWQPQKVIMVCNAVYNDCDGPEQYAFVREMIMKLKSRLKGMFNEQDDRDIVMDFDFTMPESIQYKDCLSDDTPAAVFSYLQTNCKDQKVIIDITGGKKSMIAGAFLYAAYSNNDIAYVDFDEYHPRFQRPYGITSNPQKLLNPYKIFALRNWEEMWKSYNNFTFDTAISILKEILAAVKNTTFYDDSQIKSMKGLLLVLNIYKHWNDTNYEQAKIVLAELEKEYPEMGEEGTANFEYPSILKKFTWDLKSGFNELTKYLTDDTEINETRTEVNLTGNSLDKQMFTAPEVFSPFIRDELHKAERLLNIHHDYRASFVRSASISEVLVKARIWLIRDKLTIVEEKYKDKKCLTSKHTVEDYLIRADFSSFSYLLIDSSALAILKCGNYTASIEINKDIPEKNLIRFRNEENKKNLNKILKLASVRNKTVHGCFPIPEKLAKVALDVAKSNMEEFLLWLDEKTRESVNRGNYQIMERDELKKLLALDFIPGGDDKK